MLEVPTDLEFEQLQEFAREETTTVDKSLLKYSHIPAGNGESALDVAAVSGALRLFPRDSLELGLEVLNRDKETYVHAAAKHGHLHQIPEELRIKSMLVAGTSGMTPLHYAAVSGSLHHVPSQLMTLNNLLLKDTQGWNVIHCAANNRNIYQIPPSMLTLKTLRIPTLSGDEYNAEGKNTVLHLLAKCGFLNELPEEFRSVENFILDKDSAGKTPLEVVCEKRRLNYFLGQQFSDAAKVLVSDKDWLCRNQELIDAKTKLESQQAEFDVELF